MNNGSSIEMQSIYGFISSVSFIILAHISSVFASYETTELLQNTSYSMAILVAIDTLTGNPIKNSFKRFCKYFNGKKQ